MKNNHSSSDVNHIDVEEIKRLVTIRQVSRLLFPSWEPKKSCRSPFRDDRNASFSVYEDERRWKDFTTSEGGDVLDFIGKAIGGDFIAAKDWVINAGFVTPYRDRFTDRAEPMEFKFDDLYKARALTEPVKPVKKKMPQPSDSDEALRQQAIRALLVNPTVFTDWRGWKVSTILSLAQEGSLGLMGERKAFIFKSGMKSRMGKYKSTEDGICWHFGRNALWRGNLIAASTQRVVVTEGEPDAITLIDCGLEQDGGTIVCAIPGSSYSLKSELDLLRGKEVVLAYDIDTAGEDASHKARKLLRRVASDVYLMDVHLDDASTPVKDVTELWSARGGLTVEEIERRFLKFPKGENLLERIRQWSLRRFGRDVLTDDELDGNEKTHWAEIEGSAAAALHQRIGQVRCVADDWYVQQAGIWEPMDRNRYRPLALEVLPPRWRSHERARNVISRVESEQQVTRDKFIGAAKFDTNGDILLAVQNGTVRIPCEQSRNVTLEATNSAHGFTAALAAPWHENADMPLFSKVLKDTLPDPADIDLLLDVLATALIPDCRHEAALIMQGEAGTGKSTAIAPIVTIFGSTGSTLSMSDICHPNGYKLANLNHKLINIATELNTLEMEDTGLFKQIVSGERFTARSIYGKPFEMASKATLVFLANSMPRFKHGTDAEVRRLRFVRFSRKVEQPDTTLKDKVALEAPGVLAELIRRAHELLCGQKMSEGGAYGKATAARFAVSNDPVGAFVRQYCTLGSKLHCEKDELRTAFQDFREEHEISDKFDDKTFFSLLYNRFNVAQRQARINGVRCRVLTGIGLQEVAEND